MEFDIDGLSASFEGRIHDNVHNTHNGHKSHNSHNNDHSHDSPQSSSRNTIGARGGIGNDDSPEKCAWLKEEYRRVGKTKHFHNYIYAKKSLDTFARELDLLLEFLDLNYTAFYKILKKYDKINGSAIRESKLAMLVQDRPFLKGNKISELRDNVAHMLNVVSQYKPQLPDGWGRRKVYTIGCFDLFHRGHQNVLMSLREFGYFLVVGIHDDESYFKLKNKYTIDNLETRMKNVKPFADQIFVIPSTDPELYLKSMVSEHDILAGKCCYARGDDMLQFPGREWCESVMPVHFVPRTESCSSTLIRTIYHADDPEIRKKAAFADTRYDGKPIDENGNVLTF
jgi:cytidyltransferase-like protein